MRWLAIGLVRLYQICLRRLLGRRCLYETSCSRYAIAAFREHGFIAGLRLTRARLASCRLPVRAAWALDPDGRAELLDVSDRR